MAKKKNDCPKSAASGTQNICGDISFPKFWTVFAPLKQDDPPLAGDILKTVPGKITVCGKMLRGKKVFHVRNQFDFSPFFGKLHDPDSFRKTAYVFVLLKAKAEMDVTMGIGWDYWLQAWINGEPILGGGELTSPEWLGSPSISDQHPVVRLKKGSNVLAVRFTGGKGAAVLALGGPRELRTGDFRSILSDPFICDFRWKRSGLQAKPDAKKPVDIGSRRELFIDDFIIDRMTGSAERRLHHPIPREAVLMHGSSNKLEGNNCAYHSVVQDGGRIRIYYSGRPVPSIADESKEQVTCMAESKDGINFTRPELGIHEFESSRKNNIVWRGTPSHNFTPFMDANPKAPEDQRFKAIAYHTEGGGLGAYVSPDGIHWKTMAKKRIITLEGRSGFDSQNLAFWDSSRKLYVCFFRDNTGGMRRIATCTSTDFINWTEPRLLKYTDDRQEEMYTNGIRPYFRAPHIYLGIPARFVTYRKKVPAHPQNGISDAILMSSRGGLLFDRWEEGFIRPGPEPEVWTDRNNYPAWGMVQTSPEEISLYWSEHFKHSGCRLRRGTIRTDGFVSLHAGGRDVGEMLTRPLIFSGANLEVNYATSAIGTVLFELCDLRGKAIPGFSLADSEVLYGNEIGHRASWTTGSNLASLAGKTVRLRMRLHDADVYSFRFTES
jgi:hypothetical protein